MGQSRDQVQQLFRSGVDAVTLVTAGFGPADWDRPACGTWTARETATHLLGVIDWYHDWLDRAVGGERGRPFPEAEVDQRAQDDVRRSANVSGAEAVERFQSRADEYIGRATAHWDTVYAYPFGIVTTGLHCGVAATEWHLHAWDLATAQGSDHTPHDPSALFIAAGTCVAAARGGMGGSLLGWVVPLAARRSPWKTLLKQSGRERATRGAPASIL